MNCCYFPKKSQLLPFLILLLLLIGSDPTPITGVPVKEGLTLFIVEDITDYNLAIALNQSLDSTSEIVDIRISEDLNELFFTQNFLTDYSRIIMILDQVSSPFNETIVENIERFIQEGGVFSIISPQIWRFPTSFHTLLGLSVSSGQKEWPHGNSEGDITLTIVNDTFTQVPFQLTLNSTLDIVGNLGITTPIDGSYSIATSQTTPDGKAYVTGFRKQNGFILAVPLSLNEFNSSFIPFNQFLTSVISSGIDYPESSHHLSSNPPLLPNFRISEEIIQVGVGIVSISSLLIGLAYLISKWTFNSNNMEIPKDRDWFSKIILAPLLLIGQIIYPPVVRRIDEFDVHENQFRNKIIGILTERDFMHFREIKRELNLGTSSLRWHLQVLEDFRIIKRKLYGQYEIFFLLRSEPNPNFLELHFAIISGVGFRVAKAFQEMNSWDLNALTDYLGTSRESIRYHVKKFQKINLIELKNDRLVLNPLKYNVLIEAITRRSKMN